MPQVYFFGRNKAASRAERRRCALHTEVTRVCQYESPAGERTVLRFAPLVRDAGPLPRPRCCHLPRKTRPLRPEAEWALALNAPI